MILPWGNRVASIIHRVTIMYIDRLSFATSTLAFSSFSLD
jgi:hypothetical protein